MYLKNSERNLDYRLKNQRRNIANSIRTMFVRFLMKKPSGAGGSTKSPLELFYDSLWLKPCIKLKSTVSNVSINCNVDYIPKVVYERKVQMKYLRNIKWISKKKRRRQYHMNLLLYPQSETDYTLSFIMSVVQRMKKLPANQHSEK